MPNDWKSMSGIGSGVFEIRLHAPHEFRVIYVAKFSEAIYVLHTFEKKTKKTSKKDVAQAKQGYDSLMLKRTRMGL